MERSRGRTQAKTDNDEEEVEEWENVKLLNCGLVKPSEKLRKL